MTEAIPKSWRAIITDPPENINNLPGSPFN